MTLGYEKAEQRKLSASGQESGSQGIGPDYGPGRADHMETLKRWADKFGLDVTEKKGVRLQYVKKCLQKFRVFSWQFTAV